MDDEQPIHRKDLGYNLATSNRFTVVIPIAPVMKEYFNKRGYSEDILEMNIFGTLTPNFNFNPIRENILAGRQVSLIGNHTTSDPVKFDFMVDDKYFNWYAMYYWAIQCRNHIDGTAHRWASDNKDGPGDFRNSTKPGNPNVSPYVDVSIIAMDNFNKPMLRTDLRGAHPAQLGGLQVVQQEGAEQYLKASLTLAYDESKVTWLQEDDC